MKRLIAGNGALLQRHIVGKLVKDVTIVGVERLNDDGTGGRMRLHVRMGTCARLFLPVAILGTTSLFLGKLLLAGSHAGNLFGRIDRFRLR